MEDIRTHYSNNISFVSFDGETWNDSYDLGYIVCLKVYTVEDDLFIDVENFTTNYDNNETLQATFYNYDGEKLSNTTITYIFDGTDFEKTTDENGIASISTNLPVGNYTVTFINPVNSGNETVILTVLSNAEPEPEVEPVPESQPHKVLDNNVPVSIKLNNKNIQAKTGITHKIIHDNTVVYEGNKLTLDTLQKIFNKTFTNGHLLLYIDGELVFNGTVGDDWATVILEIIEKFVGEHEIKVEFTDSNNQTQSYVKNVTIA